MWRKRVPEKPAGAYYAVAAALPAGRTTVGSFYLGVPPPGAMEPYYFYTIAADGTLNLASKVRVGEFPDRLYAVWDRWSGVYRVFVYRHASGTRPGWVNQWTFTDSGKRVSGPTRLGVVREGYSYRMESHVWVGRDLYLVGWYPRPAVPAVRGSATYLALGIRGPRYDAVDVVDLVPKGEVTWNTRSCCFPVYEAASDGRGMFVAWAGLRARGGLPAVTTRYRVLRGTSGASGAVAAVRPPESGGHIYEPMQAIYYKGHYVLRQRTGRLSVYDRQGRQVMDATFLALHPSANRAEEDLGAKLFVDGDDLLLIYAYAKRAIYSDLRMMRLRITGLESATADAGPDARADAGPDATADAGHGAGGGG